MRILVITNLYPNPAELNRAPYNKQFLDVLSHTSSLKVIAPISWMTMLPFKKRKVGSHEVKGEIQIFHPIYWYIPLIFRFTHGFTYFLSVFGTVWKIIRNQKPDCILGSWVYPDGFASVLLGKIFRIPVVIKAHGSDIHGIKESWRHKLTQWTLRHARKVLSVSDDLTRKMVRLGCPFDKIETIRNGIDHSMFFKEDRGLARTRLNHLCSTKIILFVGNLKQVKGPDLLLEAYALSTYLRQNSQLYLIGEGSFRQELQSQIETLDIGDSVQLLGIKPHNEIRDWMNAADVLVIPSRNEGIPNVIFEAAACGLPVIAANVGGISEVSTKKTALLVPPEDIDQLKLAMEEGLKRSWDRDEIANKAKSYSWERCGELTLQSLATIAL